MLRTVIGLVALVVVVSYLKMNQTDKDKFIMKGTL